MIRLSISLSLFVFYFCCHIENDKNVFEIVTKYTMINDTIIYILNSCFNYSLVVLFLNFTEF